MKIRVAVLLAMSCGMAQANTLYKCIDESGHTTYTNFKGGSRKCEVLSRDAPSMSGGSPRRVSASVPARSSSPADFPKVSTELQRSRDGDRRQIVQQEFENEQKNLAEARRHLAEKETAPGAPDLLKPIKDRIALHERNLVELRRELARLR